MTARLLELDDIRVTSQSMPEAVILSDIVDVMSPPPPGSPMQAAQSTIRRGPKRPVMTDDAYPLR